MTETEEETRIAVPAEAPPARTEKDDWLEIAKTGTYISGEPSFLRAFYFYREMVDRKVLVTLFDHRTNSVSRREYLSHLYDMIADIGGLLLKKRPTIREELHADIERIEAEDSEFQIFDARLKLAALLDEISFGIPPKTPEGDWDLTEEEVLGRIAPRIVAIHERAVVEEQMRDRTGRGKR